MKTALKVATVLSWFNIIVWGIMIVALLFAALLSGQLVVLGGLVLIGAIPLNCFAALKLHTSIRYPNIPLSHQTPVGIRFVGFMAMFFGILFVYYGVSIIGDPKPYVDPIKQSFAQMPVKVDPRMADMAGTIVILFGAGMIVLGILAAVNVVLNLRLLRWYYLLQRSDVS
jgi:hypothetical protein